MDWIPLEKEAVYLENCVALQRARSEANLQIELILDMSDKSVLVAPLIFVAFVENAFKYCTRDDLQHNGITIILRQDAQNLIFECSNSYKINAPVGKGIGLGNVKRRLELLYPGRYTLDIQQTDDFYSVHLTLTA